MNRACRGLGILVGLLLVGGCQDNVGPPREPRSGPLLNVTIQSFGGTLTPIDSKTDINTSIIGNYPNLTMVVVTATGLLTQSYGPSPEWGQNAGHVLGPWDAAGLHNGSVNQCFGNVAIGSTIGGPLGFCDYANTIPTTSTWVDTGFALGDVTMAWVRGPASFASFCDGPSQSPCFTYTGQHDISVDRISVDLYVKSTPEVGIPGQSIQLEALGLPEVGAPLLMQSWSLQYDAGGAPVPMCGTVKVCNVSPTGSGTMTVTALVNGVQQTRKRRVLVNPCPPTGDPRLDNPDFRDSLRTIINEARADPNHTERGWRWWRNGPEVSHRWERAPVTFADNCRRIGPGPGGGTSEFLDAHGHTHGYNPGAIITCVDAQGVPYTVIYRPVAGGGGSPEDWGTVDTYNNALGSGANPPNPAIPGYTVDPTTVWRLDPNTAAGNRRNNPNHWTPQPNGCYVP